MAKANIIHQIWYNESPLPKAFQILGNTWKQNYPNWEYILWNKEKMDIFVQSYYPQYWEKYNQFPYDIQRCDTVRYLILYKMGGLYVDLDYESLQSIEPLIEGKSCCFSEEPIYTNESKAKFQQDVPIYFNNAMIFCLPNHPFLKKLIESIFSMKEVCNNDLHHPSYVLQTTGPWKIMKLYYDLEEIEKKNIYIIPRKYVTPFNIQQIRKLIIEKEENEELEICLKEAYAVHYFFNLWVKEIK